MAIKGWPNLYDNYQPLELVGKGGFGQVYKCYDMENSIVVAIKINKFNEDSSEQE